VDSPISLFLDFKISGNEVYTVLDKESEYLGGIVKAVKFIQTNIQYPPVALHKYIQGKVCIGSSIDRNSKVIQSKVVYNIDSLLDQKTLRIIEMILNWKLGKLNGEAVNIKFSFSVIFRISDHDTIVDIATSAIRMKQEA